MILSTDRTTFSSVALTHENNEKSTKIKEEKSKSFIFTKLQCCLTSAHGLCLRNLENLENLNIQMNIKILKNLKIFKIFNINID